MTKLALLTLLCIAPTAALAQPAAPVSTPLGQYQATLSGQPILLPQGPVQVTVSETLIPPGASLPEHRHPYPRFIHVLEGQITVTNLETKQTRQLRAGDFAVEAVGQWHTGQAFGFVPARLLVIDQTPPGAGNMERRP